MIDASKDVTEMFLNHEKNLVKGLSRNINKNPRSDLAAAIYARRVATLARFGDDQDFDKLIDQAELDTSKKDFNRTLERANSLLFESKNKNNEKILVLLIVGKSDKKTKDTVEKTARKFLDKKVRVFVVIFSADYEDSLQVLTEEDGIFFVEKTERFTFVEDSLFTKFSKEEGKYDFFEKD